MRDYEAIAFAPEYEESQAPGESMEDPLRAWSARLSSGARLWYYIRFFCKMFYVLVIWYSASAFLRAYNERKR